MKAILVTVFAACTMVDGLVSSNPPCGETARVRRGAQTLELRGQQARVIDHQTHVSRAAPIDQVLVDTEKGAMAVIGDEAVPLTGICEARAARRALAPR